MADSDAAKSKLIIDEDWKSQVEAEKERLRQNESKPAPAAVEHSHVEHSQEDLGLPPASFVSLLTMIATQAMMCMGQIPDPASGQPILALDQAKHFIDTCDMLQQKTKGNLSSEESGLLENILHELRMAFVAVSRQAGASI